MILLLLLQGMILWFLCWKVRDPGLMLGLQLATTLGLLALSQLLPMFLPPRLRRRR